MIARLTGTLAETSADGAVIDAVKLGDDTVQLIPDRRALGLRHAGKGLIPQHTSSDEIHDVERRADDKRVFAQHMRLRDGEAGRIKRMDHAKFAIDGVRGRQQLSRRLASQHEAPARGVADLVSRVGLAALELLDRERTAQPGNVLREVVLER